MGIYKMSDNKVNNKLDFRNVKHSQFDPGQVPKMTFSELKSSLRTYSTNTVLNDAYTHFIQTTNSKDLPTNVQYYQATDTAKDNLQVRADNNGDLFNTYFIIQEYISKTTYAFYYRVNGSGTAPGVSDIEIPIDILSDDPALVVCYATEQAINTVDSIIVTRKGSSFIELEYLQFGETPAIDVGTTGFTVTREKEGQSFKVGEIDIDYDSNDNPIYNGSTLKGFKYNPYTASFDLDSGSSGSGNQGPFGEFDEIEATYPTPPVEVYDYKLDSNSIGTVTVTYSNASKKVLLSVVYNAV
jgi:hypothetical protein